MFKRRKKQEARAQKGIRSEHPGATLPRSMSVESVSSVVSEVNTVPDRSASVDFKLANIFWRASLSCHPFHVGDPLVTFGDLWPNDDLLRGLIECFKGPELQDSVVNCCKLVLRCGPMRVLRELLDQRIINVNQRLEQGMGLLHNACVACNGEAVTFLCSRGVSMKLQDKSGHTADQLCFCPKTRRCLPARYNSNSFRKKQAASFHDKKTIFELVQQPDKFNDLQICIQTMDFDINHDRDPKGNLLLHAAVKGGLPQLALIMNLVQVHGANIEAVNRKGMSPLCLAAQLGLDIFVEVLICILGADPNTQNSLNGWTALHCAAKKNQISAIDCLIRRGADLNVEDGFSMRPDDIAERCGHDECRDMIVGLRYQRCETLSQLVQNGKLVPNDSRVRHSDQFNVDNEGLTLIMAAAQANECDNLRMLLRDKKSPVNAQHLKTGRTALSMAAIDGNADVIQTLISNNALPNITDIDGRLALHYACVKGHVECIEAILDSPTGLHGLYDAYHLASDPAIKDLICKAMEKRQREIVNPTLFECSMNGDASKIYCTLEEGDDVNPFTGTCDWPMYMAVGNGHFEVIKLLQEYGGDVCSVHPTTRSTVLHVACSRGLKEIVGYLLKFCHPNETRQTLDINTVNKVGMTALQLAASKGYSSIVRMLLENGASAAIVDDFGQLYKCTEFEGVQALIERHRKNRTERVMLCIKDKKRLKYLKKIWQPKFDHNLRNKVGDTPLMSACLYGRLDAVKFLLETAVQNTEEEARNFEQSMRWRRDSDSDSGTYLESHSPGTSRKFNNSMDYGEFSTDLSDQEGGEFTGFHPALHGLYPTSTPKQSQDYSSDSDSNMNFEPTKRAPSVFSSAQGEGRGRGLGGGGRLRHGPTRGFRPYASDTESLENSADMSNGGAMGGQGYGLHYAPSLASIRSASLMSLTDTECHSIARHQEQLSIKKYGAIGMAGMMDQNSKRSPSLSELFVSLSQQARPTIYQGSTINHVCAVNPLDGCTAVHRAVQCSDQKTGLAIIILLLAKDNAIVNVQDEEGLTPLHLACKLERKQIVKKLLSLDYVDINIRTLDGNLPEQMTRSERSRIAKMVKNARGHFDDTRSVVSGIDAFSTPPASTVGGSSIDFDNLQHRFENMRHGGKN